MGHSLCINIACHTNAATSVNKCVGFKLKIGRYAIRLFPMLVATGSFSPERGLPVKFVLILIILSLSL